MHVHGKERLILPLRFSSGSQYRQGEVSSISTPRAQPMIGTERLRMRINEKLKQVGAVPSIQCTARTAGLSICSTTIPIAIEQDCVSPLEERLTGSQGGWSPPHNRLPSWGRSPWLTPPMVCVGEWSFGRSSAHGMVVTSDFCLLFVFCLFFDGLVFDGHDIALEEC